MSENQVAKPGMVSLPFRFLTPFPRRFSRRCGTRKYSLSFGTPFVLIIQFISAFYRRAQTVLAAARAAALQNHRGKAKPSTFALTIPGLATENRGNVNES
jgi:hypothetical protein